MKKSRVIVALDVPNLDAASDLIRYLKPYVWGFKVGLELISAAGGPAVIKALNGQGVKVFYDAKLHDIPNTVAGAVRAIINNGCVDMLNVHCLGGRKMMEAAVAAASETAKLREIEKPLLLGVTVLTSLKYPDFKEMGIEALYDDKAAAEEILGSLVVNLARLAQSSGMDGVIASALEAKLIRKECGDNFWIITPGIRPIWKAAGDQKRITTPAEAIQAGADLVVIGRPITNPPEEIGSPVKAAELINQEIELVI